MTRIYPCIYGKKHKCWAHTYFEERPIFGRKYLILGACATVGKKEACGKGRKSNMQEEKPRVRRKKILTILGLGFLTKVVMAISL
jgi:hypothetical protein